MLRAFAVGAVIAWIVGYATHAIAAYFDRREAEKWRRLRLERQRRRTLQSP